MAVAQSNEWILGVVGWVKLEAPQEVESYLESLRQDNKLVGIRHLLHDDPREGFLKMENVLSSLRIIAAQGLKGLYGTNEGAAIGIVNGVKELGLSGLTIIGFDSGKAQIDAINSGLMTGAITQNPVGIGYETVKAAVEAIQGKKLPKTIDTGYYWYDKSNINDAKIQAVLYQ